MEMATTNIEVKIDELADMIRSLKDKLDILIETGNCNQYIEAISTRRSLRGGLYDLENLANAVKTAESLAADAEFLKA